MTEIRGDARAEGERVRSRRDVRIHAKFPSERPRLPRIPFEDEPRNVRSEVQLRGDRACWVSQEWERRRKGIESRTKTRRFDAAIRSDRLVRALSSLHAWFKNRNEGMSSRHAIGSSSSVGFERVNMRNVARIARPAARRIDARSTHRSSLVLREGDTPRAAYVHLPFCRSRCFYCDFPISVLGTSEGNEKGDARMKRYVDAICEEIRSTPRQGDEPLKTVFFGGKASTSDVQNTREGVGCNRTDVKTCVHLHESKEEPHP